MTGGFRREDRYIVLKRSDLDCLSDKEQLQLQQLCERVRDARTTQGKRQLSCLVLESTWPEYETAWRMLETRLSSEPDT